MKKQNIHIIFYTLLVLLLLAMYYGVIPINNVSIMPVNLCKTIDVDDELKVLPPTEKKTYTSCPDNIIHNAMEIFSDVNLTEDEITIAKLRWLTFLMKIPNYPESKYSGRGIVSSTSSGFHRSGRLLASIKLLRWLKCQLPVEIFIKSGELKLEEIRKFEEIPNVKVLVIRDDAIVKTRKARKYSLKPYSIINSSFEHVLWLDSDNIPVRDPEYLFDLPHYIHSTAIFWPDFWSTPGKNPIWKILNISCRAEDYEQESGQIVINKRLSWKALNLALHFTLDPVISRVIYGDKDAFRLSWKVLDTKFYFIRKFLGIGGFYYIRTDDTNEPNKKVYFCGHTMVQHDPLGEILFLHANIIKSFPLIETPVETTHFALKNYTNLWRVYRRYANSASYLRPHMIGENNLMCMAFPSGADGNLPAVFENDFHKEVSANITGQYLSYVNGSLIRSSSRSKFRAIDRN